MRYMLVGSLLLGTSIAAAEPRVSFEEGFPEITGALDADSIHNVIKPRFDDLKQCYAKRLAVKPALSGTVLVAFVIAPDGHVDSATGVGVDVDVAGCIAAQIKRLSFAKPKDGNAAAIAYPFMFHAPDNTSAPPKIAVDEAGELKSNGDLDKAIIRRYIKRNVQKIQYCYEKQLLAKPNIEGTITAEFFITSKGTVDRSTAAGFDKDVADCVAGVLKTIEFPQPKGTGGVQVSYPFTFKQDRGSAAKPTPPSSGGTLDRADITATIKNEMPKVKACYDKRVAVKPGISGTIKVVFFVTPDGTVDPSIATGFDQGVADCVAGVIKATRFPKPTGGGVQISYPFVF